MVFHCHFFIPGAKIPFLERRNVRKFLALKLLKKVVSIISDLSSFGGWSFWRFHFLFADIDVSEPGFRMWFWSIEGISVHIEIWDDFSFLRGHMSFNDLTSAFGGPIVFFIDNSACLSWRIVFDDEILCLILFDVGYESMCEGIVMIIFDLHFAVLSFWL